MTDGDPIHGSDFLEDVNVVALGITPDLAVGVAEDHFDIVDN